VLEEGQTSSFLSEVHAIFFNIHGIVHYDFIPKGKTVNQHFYLDVLKCLWEDVQ
jgi:hypothetical protein